MTVASVAVIGAGASGTIQALHLLREGVGRVVLVEREHEAGRGVAYGTRRPEHLLNVTAGRMSVFPDDPAHFARWFEARGGAPEDYAPRMLFGDYLSGLMRAAGDRLEVLGGNVMEIGRAGPLELRLSDGRALQAEAVVLALGNLRPATPPAIDPQALGALYVADPWYGRIGDGLAADDEVLLVGTGLTAIDAALTLDSTGFAGTILGLSRRGLVPRAHLRREPVADSPPPLADGVAALLHQLRARAASIGWREAVHELRPLTWRIWRGASLDERRRFLRHLRPWWDVHRHRIAPAVADRIERMQSEGRLGFAAGRILSVRRSGRVAEVRWRPRGSDRIECMRAARIVNCTGPELDVGRCGDPLLGSLVRQGRIRPDDCGLGVDVDSESRVIDSEGRAVERIAAIGPMTRGAFWESIAISDIATQAQSVARRLAAELSVRETA